MKLLRQETDSSLSLRACQEEGTNSSITMRERCTLQTLVRGHSSRSFSQRRYVSGCVKRRADICLRLQTFQAYYWCRIHWMGSFPCQTHRQRGELLLGITSVLFEAICLSSHVDAHSQDSLTLVYSTFSPRFTSSQNDLAELAFEQASIIGIDIFATLAIRKQSNTPYRIVSTIEYNRSMSTKNFQQHRRFLDNNKSLNQFTLFKGSIVVYVERSPLSILQTTARQQHYCQGHHGMMSQYQNCLKKTKDFGEL